jgi:hypothetical protein
MRINRLKPVTIQVHPNLYKKMEEIRKQYGTNNISLSQIELTNIISKRIRTPKINLMGGKNAKVIKRKKR